MVESRQIDGRAVTFRHEPGTGPALVCVHGSADNHHVYDRLFDAMPGRDRYAINLPGRAGTDGPALGTAAEMEAFLSRFLESEVQGDYLIVGHSLGGGVAIEHALSSPSERLAGIVLLAASIRVPALIVAGTEDALTPVKYAQYLAAHIPDNELHILEGAGHMLVMERAEQLAALIRRMS